MLEDIANLISIITPVILVIWFYYSQKQILSQKYYEEVDGIYAGFTEPIMKPENNGRLYSGIIMHIRETDNKGFFKGEFDYSERELFMKSGIPDEKMRTDGIYNFMGNLRFRMKRGRKRHPFKPAQNRKYKGTLYIVDRLDFDFNKYEIETYLTAEYEILHLRELQAMQFVLKKTHRENGQTLPAKFTLYKRFGASFEPYRNVKEVVFRGHTRSDI